MFKTLRGAISVLAPVLTVAGSRISYVNLDGTHKSNGQPANLKHNEEEERFRKTLRGSQFYMVAGPPESGTTQLVRDQVELLYTQGGISPEEGLLHVTILPSGNLYSPWQEALSKHGFARVAATATDITRATDAFAEKFCARHSGARATLIVDHAERLDDHDDMFWVLHNFAKHAADVKRLKVFIVRTGADVARMLDTNSFEDRGEYFNVRNLSKPNTVQFLTESGFSCHHAEQVAHITGGSVHHVLRAASVRQQNDSDELAVISLTSQLKSEYEEIIRGLAAVVIDHAVLKPLALVPEMRIYTVALPGKPSLAFTKHAIQLGLLAFNKERRTVSFSVPAYQTFYLDQYYYHIPTPTGDFYAAKEAVLFATKVAAVMAFSAISAFLLRHNVLFAAS